MRMIKKCYKGNNKGISLVELLISLAVGAIVMSALTLLVSQGIKQYNKTTIMTQLQEDANIALNNISDSIMEGNYLVISNSRPAATFQTQDVAHDGKNVIYMVRDHCLYLGDNTANMDTMGILCKNVDEMKIEIVQSSLKTELAEREGTMQHKVVGINNPVQIKVTLTLELNGYTRSVSRVTSVRNLLDLDEMTMQGFRFDNAPFLEQFAEYIVND